MTQSSNCSENQAPPLVPRGETVWDGSARPTDPDENKIKHINIDQVSRGYIVTVGCQTFAIETSAQLISKLSEYINEPASTSKKWFAGTLF